VSAGDFMFALGQDIDYQTQQNMRNYQSQYPMGTKYYKPKRYDEGTAGANPTPTTDKIIIGAPTFSEWNSKFRQRMAEKYPQNHMARYKRINQSEIEDMYQHIYGTNAESTQGFENYKKRHSARYLPYRDSMSEEQKAKYSYDISKYTDPIEYFTDLYKTKEEGNPFWDITKKHFGGQGQNETFLPWKLTGDVYNVSAGLLLM
jgi:hypothetical protein